MKQLLPAAPVVLFPYSMALLLYSFSNQALMERLFGNDITRGVLYLGAFWAVAFADAVFLCVRGLAQRRDALELARLNLRIKLLQIPAYLLIFVVGLLCMVTIFTMAFSFVLLLFDCGSILLSGLVGVATVGRCHSQGILTGRGAALHGVLQFLFCGDVISAALVFRQAQAAAVKSR